MSLAILAPKIGYVDYPVVILFFISLYYFFKKPNQSISKVFYQIIFSWIFLILWSFITLIYNGTVNEVLILKPIRQIIIILFLIIIISKTKLSFTDIYKVIIISALINTFVISLQLYGHNVLGTPDFLMPISFDSELNVPFRKPGVFAGYPHSGLLSLFAIVCIVNKVNKIKIQYFILLFLILFFSLIVTSRTALMLSFLPIGWLFAKSLRSKKIFVKSLIFSIVVVLGLISILDILPADTTNVAFEGFINYKENGTFNTESQQGLNNSYIIPQKIATYLFGNGLANRTDVDTNIDDGYQSLLYGSGLIYFFISILLFFTYYLVTLKNSGPKNLIIISILYAIILIANYKVDCLFSRVISEIFTMLLVVSVCSKRYKLFNNEGPILYSSK